MNCCFVNDTATTENYTYGNTLSLHDPLPLCRDRLAAARADQGACPPARPQAARSGRRRDRPAAARRRGHPRRHGRYGRQRTPDGGRRSEEHTSELQSLMRISYAVFCWKKKTFTEDTKILHCGDYHNKN